MPNDIELSNLKHKPFADIEKPDVRFHRLRHLVVLSIALELVALLLVYFNYAKLFNVYPLLAPTLLGALTAALAQLVHQLMREKLSGSRLLKFMVWGCINGCLTAMWIDTLVAQFDSAMYRVLIDQTVGAPLFQLVFSVLSSLWDNDSVPHNTYFRALRYSYCYWPFVSVGMFIFVPQPLMFPCNCIANLIWNLLLSRVG